MRIIGFTSAAGNPDSPALSLVMTACSSDWKVVLFVLELVTAAEAMFSLPLLLAESSSKKTQNLVASQYEIHFSTELDEYVRKLSEL